MIEIRPHPSLDGILVRNDGMIFIPENKSIKAHWTYGTLEPNGEKLEPYQAKTEDGKKWSGYGTALKPSYEPIVVARKPVEKTVAQNCLKYGVGAINIDEWNEEFCVPNH